jgi:hypothetical protein
MSKQKQSKQKMGSFFFILCCKNKKKMKKHRGKKFSLPSFVPHSKHASEEQDAGE